MKMILDFYIHFSKVLPAVAVVLLCGDFASVQMINKLRKAGCILSRVELTTVLYQLSRHSFFSYINSGTLLDSYFEKVSDELANGYIYIIIAKTRTLPNDFISLFTNREFNHVSLAFDEKLETIVSYNGGEQINPPGMNAEELESLVRREGAELVVYRLPATKRQKLIMLNKIHKINDEGSAYNLPGLVLKTSMKPNIMFCSQFVYTLLELAELNYFEKKAASVRPTDFVDMDYDSKLEFVKRVGESSC